MTAHHPMPDVSTPHTQFMSHTKHMMPKPSSSSPMPVGDNIECLEPEDHIEVDGDFAPTVKEIVNNPNSLRDYHIDGRPLTGLGSRGRWVIATLMMFGFMLFPTDAVILAVRIYRDEAQDPDTWTPIRESFEEMVEEMCLVSDAFANQETFDLWCIQRGIDLVNISVYVNHDGIDSIIDRRNACADACSSAATPVTPTRCPFVD